MKNNNDQPRQLLEWQVCEDEHAWEAAQHTLTSSPGNNATRLDRRWHRYRWHGVVSLLVLAALGGWWAWQRGAAGIAQVESALAVQIATELWQHEQPSGPADATEANLLRIVEMPSNPLEIVTHVDIRGLGEDWAVVDVTIQPTADGPSYRQTRVYREDERGWTRTHASAARWGTVRQLESDHFIFIYHTVDEAAVRHAAPQLDILYPPMHNPLYKPWPADTKLTITLDPEQRPGRISRAGQPNPGIVVASPAAALLPTDLPPGDALLQTLVLALFNQLATETSEATVQMVPGHWNRLHNAARLWFMWEHNLPLASWRKPLVQWVLETPDNSPRRDAYAVPTFARELCAHHELWMPSPLDLHVPIHCSQRRDGAVTIAAWRHHDPPTLQSIDALLYRPFATVHDTALYQEVPLPEPGPHAIILATLLEYVSATYGKGIMPLLLTRVPQHQHADTLIPAVFGVPLTEFEQGWRAFLVEQYELQE